MKGFQVETFYYDLGGLPAHCRGPGMVFSVIVSASHLITHGSADSIVVCSPTEVLESARALANQAYHSYNIELVSDLSEEDRPLNCLWLAADYVI